MSKDHSAVTFDASIAYILSNSPQYVRAWKNIATFASLFREVHYIGCSRGKKWVSEETLQGVSYHMDDRTLPHGAKSIFSAFAFLAHIRRHLLLLKPDVVVATNEEYILPFTVGYFPRPKYLICDLTDSLAIRMMGPLRHAAPLWSCLSEIAKRQMDGMIEVTDERLARHIRKPGHTEVIFNSPHWCDIEPLPEITVPSIYVCGSSLDGLSGIETLLAAVEQVPEVQIVFAGQLVGPWLNNHFIKHPKVRNFGEVTPAKSLRIAKSCSAIFAHYRPFVTNYVYAAPNKLFDAMMLGVPLLINSECKASLMAGRFEIGITTPFGDVAALKNALTGLLHDNQSLRDSCQKARDLFRKEYGWDIMAQRWEQFFREIGVPSGAPDQLSARN